MNAQDPPDTLAMPVRRGGTPRSRTDAAPVAAAKTATIASMSFAFVVSSTAMLIPPSARYRKFSLAESAAWRT